MGYAVKLLLTSGYTQYSYLIILTFLIDVLLTFDHKKRLIPLPETVAIPEFSAIWENDPSDSKRTAINELSFVYFSCAYDSPYRAFTAEEKETHLKKDFGIPKITPDRIKDAITKYRQIMITPSMRFLEAAQKACDSMRQYFESLDFGERDDYGRPVYKATEVSKCLKDCNGIIESLSALKERVNKELSGKVIIRGGGNIGAFEDATEKRKK